MTAMSHAIDDSALDTLFRKARSQNKWLDKPVTQEQLVELYDLMKWGPTNANGFPIRIVFVVSEDGKKRLVPLVSERNGPKVSSAPVTAILAYDIEFYEWLPRLFPHRDMRTPFVGKPKHAEVTAFRSATLQGGYFILAARALGLDCGPMSGFDNEAVDLEFFPDGKVKSNFICGLGYGDPSGVLERLPRPSFSEVCSIL